jgi:hypothetical protein
MALGGGLATPKLPKKKKRKMDFGLLGVVRPPPRAWGGLVLPHTGRRGWPKPP